LPPTVPLDHHNRRWPLEGRETVTTSRTGPSPPDGTALVGRSGVHDSCVVCRAERAAHGISVASVRYQIFGIGCQEEITGISIT